MESFQKTSYQKKSSNYRGGYKKHYRGNNQQYRNYNKNVYNNYNHFTYLPQYYNPYFQQEMYYRTEMYIYSKYRHLIDINQKNQDLSKKIDNNSQFFIIKSFSEEDVHKSIKYGVWSSSKNGNLTLSNAYKLSSDKGGNVYLFFSCNGSGRYIGLAKMKTSCDEKKSFEYWTQDNKWPGLFEVEWIFIKDVPFKEFKNIVITMRDGETKPITNARDTQEIPFEQAKIMVEIMEKYQNTNTILEHFEYYDLRQDNYEKSIMNMRNNQMNNNSGNNNNNMSGNNINNNNKGNKEGKNNENK
jgi:hypothetical protein